MRKVLITIAAFFIVGVAVFGVAAVLDPQNVGLPQPIESDSPCPATSCASGDCHSFDDVPDPDETHEMTCPEAGCASLECHAWGTLVDRYHQASGASLNLWIFVPVALIVALVVFIKRA